MKDFKPALIDSLKGYTKKQLMSDIVSGIIVAIIALPLSIALALASGVGPEEGLYTAIIAGFLIAALGGSRVQISGPTAAFATIVAGIVAQNGLEGLALATIMAGIILVLMGIFRLGALIKFIPFTITTGFTAGIAVTIFIGQLKDFFGLTYPAGLAPIETIEKAEAVIHNFGTINPWAVLIGLISLAILIFWPKLKYVGQIPASLVAVIVGAVLVKVFALPVNTIGDLYTVSSSLPTLRLPGFDFALIHEVLPDAFTIAILAAIESLLSCVVADGMTNTKHNSNAELIAQGVGNIGSALFGGIPATGAIARTSANIKSGGKTPISGMVHAVVLLLILVLLMPYAELIPMPVIAAVLFIVAYNMCQARLFILMVKTTPGYDKLVLLVTFLLTVVFDLVVAIVVGLALACLLFMKQMSDETHVTGWKYTKEEANVAYFRELPREIRVYEINGPLFFGAADRIADITAKSFTKCIILRMQSHSGIDATAMHALIGLQKRCAANGISLVFSQVNNRSMHVMQKAGFIKTVGKENFCSNVDAAIARAKEIIKADETVNANN